MFASSSSTRLLDPKVDGRIPVPSHRHAAPSAPWPWVDIQDKVDQTQLDSPLPPIPPPCDHKSCNECWNRYPPSRFPNWTESQVRRSKIADAIKKKTDSIIYHVDVDSNGLFTARDKIFAREDDIEKTWKLMKNSETPENIRLQTLFVEDMSGPLLRMLRAKYNIEPFFFSSSLNWIPSRYAEEIVPKKGDHITITLTFLKSLAVPQDQTGTLRSTLYGSVYNMIGLNERVDQMIDIQAPLKLQSSNSMLALDLLSVHLIRKENGSTMISYHHGKDEHGTTTVKYLQERIRFAGQSVLVVFLWHAMYAWDEALESLYSHVCWLETQVISTSDLRLTQELYIIRAHHLHYSSLLEDFKKSVEFVQKSRNPAMDSLEEEVRKNSAELMDKECGYLLKGIERLEMGRRMQDERLKNVMNLIFSTYNIMKQISYLTTAFIPASFMATVFGMNVKTFSPGTAGTLLHYFEAAGVLTIITMWFILAFQRKNILPPGLVMRSYQLVTKFWDLLVITSWVQLIKYLKKFPKRRDGGDGAGKQTRGAGAGALV
ncbi:hypothetical protein BDZ94DRAFT_1265618 [Collybia nuda]|uniref:Magnesium transporter n=1 Tax=Collybia nuda TaxID=64659 RepID=A0A9P5XZN0_9AGAR|nr:hypothetical protein BDZ94DRAFT_1265618 [Collybia nuda]